MEYNERDITITIICAFVIVVVTLLICQFWPSDYKFEMECTVGNVKINSTNSFFVQILDNETVNSQKIPERFDFHGVEDVHCHVLVSGQITPYMLNTIR